MLRKFHFHKVILGFSFLAVQSLPIFISPAISAEQAVQEDFIPSVEIFKKFTKIVCMPQQLPKIHTQSIGITRLKDNEVDLQWIWRTKDANVKTSDVETIKNEGNVEVQHIGEFVITSRPIIQADIDDFFPNRNKGILAKIQIQNLTIQEAHWLIGAFKDNKLYQEIPLLYRLFSDIIEGKVSTKLSQVQIEKSSNESGSDSDESYEEFENPALPILLEYLDGTIASLSTLNRLIMMNISEQGMIFGVQFGDGNSSIHDLSDLNQAKWLFDMLGLHPAFPDASTYSILVDTYKTHNK